MTIRTTFAGSFEKLWSERVTKLKKLAMGKKGLSGTERGQRILMTLRREFHDSQAIAMTGGSEAIGVGNVLAGIIHDGGQ